MPNYYRFEQQFFEYLKNLERNIKASPVYLGVGSGGGASIIGTLPQSRVSYDTNEYSKSTTSSVPTLLDNLNHIRYDIVTLQDAYLSGAGVPSGGGLTQGHNIYDGAIELTQREKLVLEGAGVTIVDNPSNDSTDITINPNFLTLTDTPSSYVTESGKALVVTGTEDGIEFIALEVGVSGNKIIRYDAGGEIAEEYAVTETGLKDALGDAASGDIVLLPPQTITATSDGYDYAGIGSFIVKEGVTLQGMSREHSRIVANISTVDSGPRVLFKCENDSRLENLTIEYTRSNGGSAYPIYYSYGAVAEEGVTLKDVTVVAENTTGDMDITLQIPLSEDRDIVSIDNCSFYIKTFDDGEIFVEVYGGGTQYKTKTIIKNSTFVVINEVGGSSVYLTALYPGMDSSGKLLIENCYMYAELEVATSSTNKVRGIEGYGNIELRDSVGIAKSAGTNTSTEAIGIGLWASIYPSYPDDDPLTELIVIQNCIGLAYSESTSTSSSYATVGLEMGDGALIGGFYRATCGGSSDQVFGGRLYGDDYRLDARNATFQGDTYDLRADNGWQPIHLYGCQYNTLNEPNGAVTIEGGDRASFYPESYHSKDIEDEVYTRHLPLPTISGKSPVANGSEWVLADAGGYTTLLSLTDTPTTYSGSVGKVVIVNDMEDGVEFTTISGAVGASGVDQKVKISYNDSQESYLANKLIAGSGIIVVEENDGSFETLKISASVNDGSLIVRYDAGGDALELYAVTEAGLTSALNDSSSGDIVELPPQTITWTSDGTTTDQTGCINIPEGVTLRGQDKLNSTIDADVTDAQSDARILIYVDDDSRIENLTVIYNRNNSSSHIYGIYSQPGTYDGMTLKDINLTVTNEYTGSTSGTTYGFSIKVKSTLDTDSIVIDGCVFNTFGHSASNYVYNYSASSMNSRVIIQDSTFRAHDPKTHSYTSTYPRALWIVCNSNNRTEVKNCNFYASAVTGFSSTSIAYGFFTSQSNTDLYNCYSEVNNDGVTSSTGAEAYYIRNWLNSHSRLDNCIGIATSASTSTSSTYLTVGCRPEYLKINNSRLEATCSDTGLAYGIYPQGTCYVEAYYTKFSGTTKDLYITGTEGFELYDCIYSTVEGTGLVFERGDRAAYEVEDYHASDIEDDTLTRHLPAPTASGYTLISDGNQWVVESGSGTFKQLLDTPDDYTGMANKTIIVNPSETAIEFITGGTGDMLKSVYDTDDNGIVDQAEEAPWEGITNKPSTYTPSTHNHDDRYYKETEIDLKFADHDEFLDDDDTPTSYAGQGLKAVIVAETEDQLAFVDIAGISSGVYYQVLTSENDEDPDFLLNKFIAGSGIVLTETFDGNDGSIIIDTTASGVGDMTKSVYDTNDDGIVNEAHVVTWSGVSDKPSTYPPDSHDHDDRYYTETDLDNGQLDNRYYTETEVNTKLALQDEFTELTDSPSSYVGEGNKVIAVKDTEDGLEFVVQSGAGSGAGASTFTELTDSPSSYVGEAGKYTIVNNSEDGLEFTASMPTVASGIGVRVYNSSDISIGTTSDTALTFNSERWDTDNIHDTVSNTGRLTCKTAGKYMIVGGIDFALNSSGIRQIFIRLNGTTDIGRGGDASTSANTNYRKQVTSIYELSVDDYVELIVYQNSGGDLDILSVGNRSPEFMMQLIEVGEGTSDLINLDDTPVTYSGASGQSLVVNDEEDGVEFVTVSGGGSEDIGCRVYNNTAITIPHNTDTALTFNSERYDTDTIHTTGSNTNRLTCKTAGVYSITGHVQFEGNGTGHRTVFLRLNGSTDIGRINQVALTSPPQRMAITTHYDLSVNDYVEILVHQNSVGDLDIQSVSNTSPEFMMQKF
jgi:hypothetical protein